MGLGEPVGFNPDLKCNASIGIDCHANNSADILTQLRFGMQHARGADNVRAVEAGEYPSVKIRLEEVFNLGTLQGARAVGMGDDIGSIEVGKLADIVVFNGTSPNMVCAAEEDPLAAVVLHANVGDVEMVIVDGVVRKEAGRLVDVGVLDGIDGEVGEILSQRYVSRRLLESRGRVIERAEGQNAGRGMEFLYKTFG
jgi:cytosine/adenosine deaminase-related metal-dependent hydrolase